MDTQFLQVSEGRIAYDDQGRGPLVIGVPGMGDLRGEFRFLIPQLVEAGYRVVTMDVRGHGETSTGWSDFSVAGVGSDILALIRQLDAGSAVVIGNSMAAGAAVWAAAEAPDLINALVLIGPAVRGEINWSMRLLFSAFFSRPWGASAWLKYYATLFPTRKPADWVEYTTGLRHNLSQPGRLESLQKMIIASKAASESRLAKINCPALIVMGGKDPDFKQPSVEADWVASKFKGIVQMVEGAGHYPHSEMPEVTGPRIIEFLKKQQLEVSLAAQFN
jgi:pimeloyl-ACP methyl ester carboxylesterase